MIVNQKLVNAVVTKVNQRTKSAYSPEAVKMRRLEQDVRTLRAQIARLQKLVEEKLG
jgi:outer membrane murein-binding lipoprotein Lpp